MDKKTCRVMKVQRRPGNRESIDAPTLVAKQIDVRMQNHSLLVSNFKPGSKMCCDFFSLITTSIIW